jgi:hypothetical protein
VQIPPFKQGWESQTLIGISQWIPVYPSWQEKIYMFKNGSEQTPLFKHGFEAHSCISILQDGPV